MRLTLNQSIEGSNPSRPSIFRSHRQVWFKALGFQSSIHGFESRCDHQNYMNYFVYKTTNIKNGKTYIGCHQTKNINDEYLGSGKLLKRSIEKYGRENFVREILFFCNDKTSMFKKEKELISLLNPEYNLHEGGNGGFSYINENKLGVPFWITRESRKRAAKKTVIMNKSIESRERSRLNPPSFKGKVHSEETKRKISESLRIRNHKNKKS